MSEFAGPGRIARCSFPSPTLPLPRFCGCSSAVAGPSSPRTWSWCSFGTSSRFWLVSSSARGFALPTVRSSLPEPPEIKLSLGGDVHRRDRLGGLVHEYYRAAA